MGLLVIIFDSHQSNPRAIYKTYLDLIPPVPPGASGDEMSPSLTVTGDPAGSTPADTHLFQVFLESTSIRHVYFDLRLFLLPSSVTGRCCNVWDIYTAVWNDISKPCWMCLSPTEPAENVSSVSQTRPASLASTVYLVTMETLWPCRKVNVKVSHQLLQTVLTTTSWIKLRVIFRWEHHF